MRGGWVGVNVCVWINRSAPPYLDRDLMPHQRPDGARPPGPGRRSQGKEGCSVGVSGWHGVVCMVGRECVSRNNSNAAHASNRCGSRGDQTASRARDMAPVITSCPIRPTEDSGLATTIPSFPPRAQGQGPGHDTWKARQRYLACLFHSPATELAASSAHRSVRVRMTTVGDVNECMDRGVWRQSVLVGVARSCDSTQCNMLHWIDC